MRNLAETVLGIFARKETTRQDPLQVDSMEAFMEQLAGASKLRVDALCISKNGVATADEPEILGEVFGAQYIAIANGRLITLDEYYVHLPNEIRNRLTTRTIAEQQVHFSADERLFVIENRFPSARVSFKTGDEKFFGNDRRMFARDAKNSGAKSVDPIQLSPLPPHTQ